ncbi:MAG: Zn-ribbon domain-containing OB-fold protein [Alphaproteobacteria bacterium]|jgi:hypothetical protein|nr:Zn-ribbon domain-containing OB-fold protein [Alphaproteobacteria bacterium]MDP6564529.1 Zn-ribbon domain-containing OB-fold protein [Alphaproteobacteria bacterium]MDP6811665.1 Zn-ribbon domain-containing OB-fold protein [Alphaproteobacteria bacterium]
MTAATYDKPLPPPNEESRPFWEAMKEHRLVLQKCGACGKVRHYPRPVCDACFSMDTEWMEASGKGQVHSWTISHHAFHPGFKGDLPLVLVIVDLDEGVRMCAQARDLDPEGLRIGLPVRVDFEDATDDLTLPVIRPA